MDKTKIIETLAGYARAEAIIENERAQYLSRMTAQEAAAVSQDLQQAWDAHANAQVGLDRLALRRVETLLIVRRAFEILARARGLL